MSARSLNKAMLIGNLTRDPELRYTPQGTAVCSFGLATNRGWTTDAGEKREEAEFHRIVAWNKLAELCSQLLTKGRKVFVEGRLQTRTWQAQDGTQRTTTEVVIDDMILLDSRKLLAETPATGEETAVVVTPAETPVGDTAPAPVAITPTDDTEKKKKAKNGEETGDEKKPETEEAINPDDIPF